MLTTNIGAYIEQVRKNLATYTVSEDWQAVATYIEMPQVPMYAYGVTIVAHKTEKNLWVALVKNWKPDSVANNVGIFNLACTPMLVAKKNLDSEIIEQIQRVLAIEIGLSGEKPLMLDGMFCQLKVHTLDKIYIWNSDKEANQNLIALAEIHRQIRDK